MWFLKQGVILTKDNLARRHCNESQACYFCSKLETIQHLFFECHYARFLWHSLHIVFGISPRNINHLFNDWAKLGGHRYNLKLLTSATTIWWAIWLTSNDSVFNNCYPKTFYGFFSGDILATVLGPVVALGWLQWADHTSMLAFRDEL